MSGRSFFVLAMRAARLRDCERGATAIEFAFVSPMVIAILLAIAQISVAYIAQSYLEAVTESAMRVVLTNQSYTMTQNDFNTAVCAKVTALFDCNKLVVNLTPITASSPAGVTSSLPTFDTSGNLSNPTSFNPGSTNDKMLLIIMYQWPVIGGPLGLTLANMGNGTRLLVSTEVFYKEPCLNASGCQSSG